MSAQILGQYSHGEWRDLLHLRGTIALDEEMIKGREFGDDFKEAIKRNLSLTKPMYRDLIRGKISGEENVYYAE